MVWSGKIPVNGTKKATPATTDEFNNSVLPQQLEWNYQPRADKWSLTERPGYLRLYAFKPLIAGNILKAGNTLTQRVFRTPKNEATVKIDITHMTDGERGGLAHFGSPNYATIGIVCRDGNRMLEFNSKGIATLGDSIKQNNVWLRSTWGLDGISQFYYSLDGEKFIPFGANYQLAWGSYRGDRVAIYNYNDQDDTGYVDVDWFHYSY